MRIREKTYLDYGIDRETKKKLLKHCRNLTTSETEELKSCVESSCDPGLVQQIMESLTSGISYDRLSEIGYIPCSSDDFYAYRRKSVAKFYRILKDRNEM